MPRMGRRQLSQSSDSAKGIRCERILVQIAVGFQIRRSTPIVNLEKIDVLKIDFRLRKLFLPSVGIGQIVDAHGCHFKAAKEPPTGPHVL